jgi:hypothetical protein
MVTLEQNRLTFRFPKVHTEAALHVQFQRTLRIPDDNRTYLLPPGLGAFPIAHVDDYADCVPDEWVEHGGVFLPMYQAEALWINFGSWRSEQSEHPIAVKVAAGKINAVTGEPWRAELSDDPQDYLVVPGQPWLDGFCIEKGVIRQFVAMALGEGYTAEEQLTGVAEHGGIQILAYPMKAELAGRLLEQRRRTRGLLEHGHGFLRSLEEGGLRDALRSILQQHDSLRSLETEVECALADCDSAQKRPEAVLFDPALRNGLLALQTRLAELREQLEGPLHTLLQLAEPRRRISALVAALSSARATPGAQIHQSLALGLAPGGKMRQEIYRDPYGVQAWDQSSPSRCFVHILNSLQYEAVTGELPPTRPPTAADYSRAGLPWFDCYDADRQTLEGAGKLAGLDSVASKGAKLEQEPLPENEPVAPTNVRKLSPQGAVVREGPA